MGIININKLNPHPKNDFYFTDITGDKYEEIKRSIDTYGIRDPLKVTTAYTIISGHQRYRIATDLGLIEVPVEIVDVDEWQAEYMLIAENIERRGEAESDPIKKGRIAGFLKEYWGVKNGGDRKADRQNGEVKNIQNIADFINEPKRNAERLLKLNSLIPQLQSLVSSGALGTTATEQLSHLTEEEQQALFETLGNDVGDITVEESKMIRQEVQGLRDENKSLQDTIESLKNQSPRIVHKEVVREVVPDKVSNEMKKLKELYESSESERVRLEEYIKSDEYKLLDNERKWSYKTTRKINENQGSYGCICFEIKSK